jgi:hypothetical protein
MSKPDRKNGQNFLIKHFDAHIGSGAKRFHTALSHEFQSMKSQFHPYGSVDPCDHQVYVEESVDISLRESDYQRLLDLLGHLQQHEYTDSYAKHLDQKLAFERNLRDKHPGVKKAYERYRILLDMVAQGKDIED